MEAVATEQEVNTTPAATETSNITVPAGDMTEVKRKPGRPIDPLSKRQQELRAKGESTPGQRGRPVDPNSARQKRLAEMELKQQSGEVRRGRPIDPNSKRQQQLQLKGETTGQRGRPVDPNSKRQLELAAKAEREKARQEAAAKLAAEGQA